MNNLYMVWSINFYYQLFTFLKKNSNVILLFKINYKLNNSLFILNTNE